MKISIHSDYHLEFSGNNYRVKELAQSLITNKPDVVCLLGDMVGSAEQLHYLLTVVADNVSHVLFVPGNHEFYYEATLEEYEEVCDSIAGATLLDRKHIDLFGFRFHGVTLWSRFPDASEIEHKTCINGIADFRLVHDYAEVFKKSSRDEQWLRDSLADSPSRNIVLSHFSPFRNFYHPEFPNSLLTKYFHNDYDYILDKDYDVVLMGYGHTHYAHDNVTDHTCVIANSRGYYDGECPNYDVHKIITLS